MAQLVCREWHLVPKCVTSTWWCCRTPYLPTVEVVDTVCGSPYTTLWAGVVGLVEMGGRVYLRWKAGMFSKSSSHMWGNWYFPMFLLRDRSLTLMSIASLMVLVRVCDSLPPMEKLSNLVWWPQVLVWS